MARRPLKSLVIEQTIAQHVGSAHNVLDVAAATLGQRHRTAGGGRADARVASEPDRASGLLLLGGVAAELLFSFRCKATSR